MKKLTYVLLALTLLAGRAWATDFPVPSQSLKGGGSLGPGDLAEVWVTPLTSPPNLEGVSYAWRVYDSDWNEKKAFEFKPGYVIFGTGIKPTKFKVFVAATYLYVVKDAKGAVTEVATRNNLLSTDVEVKGDGPAPQPPAPAPQPPDPNFPPGQFGLSKTAYDATKLVSSATKVAEAHQLAGNFKSLASMAAAGSLQSLEDMLKQTADKNRATLGASVAAWDPFLKTLQDALYGFYEQNKLDLKTAVAAWNEVALGMEAVK